MKVIIPMAGMGKRMRPHTLTTPKPLIPVAGKPIVHRLVEDIAQVCDEKIDEVAFVVGRFGDAVEKQLHDVAASIGAKASIYYQDEALGTAHAVWCANEAIEGKTIVAFADTLFRAEFTLDEEQDGIIWVQKIEDPSQFGVVKLDDTHTITGFVEKPKEYVSDLAIIGIYYFHDGENLLKHLNHLIDNKVLVNGEYQLTDALENMRQEGTKFIPGEVAEWLDCGNKNATVQTNQRMLEIKSSKEQLVHSNIENNNSIIIEPCYIGEGAKLNNSIIGPHVSIGPDATVESSVISNSIVQENTSIDLATIKNSMIGKHATVSSVGQDLSISDYSTLKV